MSGTQATRVETVFIFWTETMIEPIKLLTLWFGPLPPWYDLFAQRMAANISISWDLIRPSSVEEVCALAERVAHVPCRKKLPYNLCDLRPLFGEMYQDRLTSYRWWGWCDMDTVIGNLDSLLPPLLVDYDIISSDWWTINGALTLLRNKADVNSLWRDGDYREVLGEPDYYNFDEHGFNGLAQVSWDKLNDNPSFTTLVKQSALRCHFDNRSWNEGFRTLPNGVPSRGCELVGGNLLETPTERELLLYHFREEWPLPDRAEGFLENRKVFLGRPGTIAEPMSLEDPAYSTWRAMKVIKDRAPNHVASFDASQEDWMRTQKYAMNTFRDNMAEGSRVLDLSCGNGGLLMALGRVLLKDFHYTGVDVSAEMVNLADTSNRKTVKAGRATFAQVGGFRSLPFEDKSFDWCVCRSLEGSVKTHSGLAAWKQITQEMLRVARKALIMDLEGGFYVME